MRKKAPKKNLPLWLFILIGALMYLLMSFFFAISKMAASGNVWGTYFASLGDWWFFKLPISGLVMYVFYVLFSPPLDSIKDVRVGHGQHGDARFMTLDEANEAYPLIRPGEEKKPGFLVGLEDDSWRVDSSDNNLLLLAPPGGGKTTAVYIPTIAYNARVNLNTGGQGASLLIVDIKGALYQQTAAELQRCGYRTPVLDMRNVYTSYRYNIMADVNEAIDAYKAAGSPKRKAMYYGRAERYAKIAADAIVDSSERTTHSEGSEYFTETAKGLIVGLILMVATYAPPDARHIISVFELVAEYGVQMEDAEQPTRTRLTLLVEQMSNKRIRNYTSGSTGADIRTILNIASSALAKMVKFVDAEFEQLICGQSPELTATEFVRSPTALFLICPDENPTRHFLASLFIRTFTNNLIELAESYPGGRLPRDFLYLIDEFGNFPPIKGVVSLFSAIRSRGGRVMIALQSYAQLQNSYSREVADIIRDTCQMLMFSFVAPSAEGTATTLSKMLGNETVQTGGTSVSRGITTSSYQMVGRPLVSADQLVTMDRGIFILMKGGLPPYQGRLKGYWEYLKLEQELRVPVPELSYMPVQTVSERSLLFAAKGLTYTIKEGMFTNV